MMTTNKALGLYLHIPFCVQKCKYCDFLSYPGMDHEKQVSYANDLINEIEYYGELYHNKYYVDTIFIGGGTPSLMEEALTDKIISAVRANFLVEEEAEVTIESNPKTLTRDKLAAYLEAGINRLSIGAQSLDDRLLKFMGRIHKAGDVIDTYRLARECGFQNINLDLMFAIPGQTMELWQSSLEQVIELGPEHVSFYSLQLEEGTPFFQMFKEGIFTEISDELDRQMYHWALKKLGNRGYTHYEISNAAREGFACRHNLKYWSMDDYLGLGLGAHSFIDGCRFSNETDINAYIGADPNRIAVWSHHNTEKDNISEYIFTGMRKMQGISLCDFQNRFGKELQEIYPEETQRFLKESLIKIEEGHLRFTLKGIDLSNHVLSDFV